MRRLTNILVLIFLYLQCINCNELFKQKVIYSYKGKVLMKNVASDSLASIYTISGKLSVEDLTDHITFKLDDVKTRIFNGDPETLNSVLEKEIPEESKIIQEPFMVYPGNKAGYNITHKSDEPIWSLNMKRSIANIFFLNTDGKTNTFANETTIFGDCKVRYKISNKDELIVLKTIYRTKCENSPNYDVSNVEWDPTAKDFEPIKSETKRIYYFDDPEDLKKVESISLTTYQSMPGVRSKQIIKQNQEFIQISKMTTFDPSPITELTETSTIIFDYSEGDEGGRLKEIEKKTSNELIEFISSNYEEFREYFEKVPLTNIKDHTNDNIFFMKKALEVMDKDTLLRLEKKMIEKDEILLEHLFVSYLPYLGTHESLAYIKDLVAGDEKFDDLLTIKILATMPIYIKNVTQNLVEEMEILMNLINVSNIQVTNAGILCFASIVSFANEKDELSMKQLTKYVSTYFENYEEADNYETKMVWLLGLINMLDGLNYDVIFSIITDPEESRHIRVLAIYGFKDKVLAEHNHVYSNIWPIVKNNSEPFEVRVACLDLLLYSQITEEQFKTIVNWYNDELSKPGEQHLANYMYTSLKALQNTTGYYEYLGDLATETLQNIKPVKISKYWSTGNYRMAYTDSDANFGAAFQARLISNPLTNVLNSAFLTVDSFTHSLNFGKYSVYIKAEGFADMLFSYYEINKNVEQTVPKLLELVRKNAYLFKKTDTVHFDVVIFSKGRVVFSMHVDQYNIDDYMENPLLEDLLSLIIDYNSLSFPVIDYNYEVSDLGTAITISTDIVDVSSYEIQNINTMPNDTSSEEDDDIILLTWDLHYRSFWYYSLYTETYNPLIDASIVTNKYVGDEKRIHVPFSFNLTSMSLQWKNEKDAINIVGDHLIGTMVDKRKVLHEYCANCDNILVVNNNDWETVIGKPSIISQVLGVIDNITINENSPEQIALYQMKPTRTASLEDIIDHHQSITFDNMAESFLLFTHFITYHKFICNDLYRYSIRISPYYDDPPSETLMEISFDLNDDGETDEHPIAKDNVNVSITLTTRKQHDAEILSHMNVTYRFFSGSESNDSKIQPHIYNKYHLEIGAYSNIEPEPIKVCIHRDVLYPSRRTNKFSLNDIDNTIANTTFKYGRTENIAANCLDYKAQFYITEVYSASENLKRKMLASSEYKNCVKQSKGLKYTPPTEDCFAAHEIISKYDICNIYGDTITADNSTEQARTEHGSHLIKYAQLNESSIEVTLIDKDLPVKLRKVLSTPNLLPLMTINPRVYAYNDDLLEWGLQSACYITPNRILTFTGHTLKKYYEKSNDESVAFVECSNTTAKGMTIQRYGNKYVGFHLYSYNYTLIVSVPNADGKLKIKFNDVILNKLNKIESDELKFYFLDNNVIYFTSDLIDILYNGEYISLQIFPIYNNYICGLCAESNIF